MDWKFIITIILAIVFGIPAFLALKSATSTKIYFIEESIINLYDKVVKNISGLKITYNGNSIKENMFVLRGFFYCSGRKDIKRSDITKNINLLMDEGTTWHDCKIISHTKDLDPKIELNQNEVLFEYELLKNKDFIYFEALGEGQKNKYEIEHRIANIPTIKKNKLEVYKSIKEALIYGLLAVGLSAYLLLGQLMPKIKADDLDDKYFHNNIEISKYNIENTTRLKLDSLKGNLEKDSLFKTRRIHFLFNKTLKIALPDNYIIKYETYDRDAVIFSAVGFIIFLLFGSLAINVNIQFYFKRKEIYKKLIKEIEKAEEK